MAIQPAPGEPLRTPEEYLEMERAAVDVKSQLVDGRIYAMAGGTPNHALIAANVIRDLGNQLKQRPCRVFSSDARVRTAASDLFTYPDVTVVCGELKFHDNVRDTITNPVAIVEVLSPSTQGLDRGLKFDRYQSIPELTDYVLVSQEEPRVDVYHRTGATSWTLEIHLGLDAVAAVESIGCSLALSEVYSKVEFRAS
jgi:Uma2 family endonuclease